MLNIKHNIIILIILLCSIGQSQNQIDSLKRLISKSKTFYEEGQLDSAYYFANISYHLAKELNEDSLQVEISGTLSYLEPDIKKALSYLEESELHAINNKQWKYLENIYYVRGSVYYHKTDDENSLIHFLKLDSLLEIRKNNQFLRAMTKVTIVNALYRSRAVNDTSFFPQMSKNINDGLKLVAEGLKISEDSVKFFNAYNLNVPAAILYEKRAYIHAQRKEPKKAIYNYQKALSNTISNDNHLRKSSIYNELANLYNKENLQDSALHYYKEALEAINKTTDTLDIAIANYNIAKFYNNNKQPKTALKHLNTSQALMESAYFIREDYKYDIQNILSSVYFNLGNFKKAFEASEKARYHLKLIETEYNKKNILELEKKYQTEKKEQQIALLASENALMEQKQKSQQKFYIGAIVLTTIAGIFLFILYNNRKKTNTQLKELDKAKSNFFTNISHEFRTPLTLINIPIENTLDDETIDDNKRQQFIIAKRNSDRLLDLVNQVLDLSKIDAGKLKLFIQKGNVTELISALSESFLYKAQQKQIQLYIDINDKDKTTFFDKDAIEKIIVNLLSNAVKYTEKNGEVFCTANINNNKLTIEIRNSGKGLSKTDLLNIFQRFYQTSEKNKGSGLGLALVKELVELHKGTIKATSNPDSYTIFTVTLPIDKNSFKNETFIEGSESENTINLLNESETQLISSSEFKDSDLPILLIVEDNSDLRAVLNQTFKSNYNILIAKNGEEGTTLAIEHIPDIIISDIMMPIKDGIVLTKELKTNELTSHIPIILLTAKVGDNNKLSGLEVGADDYITKPFNTRLLLTKTEKLIETRRLLQQRYSQELVLVPKDISITNLDEQFLGKVQAILGDNLLKSSFSVKDFSNAAGMSRMQLHRKLKALTGLTATEFIRSQRLKLAAKLLETSDINISQVGYSVGFNDHSYFAKCFKEAYNCTPTAYAKRK